jgi:HD-GYP domain-containing protein (c-di-GMP phosphodiesterase class II)
VGARLLEKFPEFADGAELVLCHHERWDSRGYPRGLAGETIPFGARVIAVTDTWDAMTSHRAYRQAMDVDAALAEIQRGRGSQFDAQIADAFLELLHRRPELARQHTDFPQEIDVPAPAPRLSAS